MPAASRYGSGFAWALCGRLVRAGGQIIFALCLARAVGPMGFATTSIGLIGHQIVVTLASQSFSHGLIQSGNFDRLTVSTAFWLNLVLALASASCVAAVGQPAEQLLHLDAPGWLLPGLAATGALAALPISGQARLTAELAFGRIARIEAGATVLAVAAGLFALWCGWGLFSVLVYTGVQRCVELVCFLQKGSLPKLVFDRATSQVLLRFSLPLAFMEILVFINNSVDQVFVGANGSAQGLGYFGLARRLTQQPTQMIAFSLDRIMFPALLATKRSQGKDERARLYLAAVQHTMLLAPFPFFILAAVAGDFIRLVIGGEWTAAVPFLSLFALTSALQPVGGVFNAALRAEGRTRLLLAFVCLRLAAIVAVLALVSSIGGGVWQLAVAAACVGVLSVAPVGIASARAMHVPILQLAGRCGASLVPSLVAAGAAIAARNLAGDDPLIGFILEAATGTLAGSGMILLLFPPMRAWLKQGRRWARSYG